MAGAVGAITSSAAGAAAPGPRIPFVDKFFFNGKTYIQWINETCVQWSLQIPETTYKELTPGTPGPQRFLAECKITYEGKPITAIGHGDNKKAAGQLSAWNMLNKLQLTATTLAKPSAHSKPVQLLKQLIIASETDASVMSQEKGSSPPQSPAKFPRRDTCQVPGVPSQSGSGANNEQNNFKKQAKLDAELKTVKELLAIQSIKRNRMKQEREDVTEGGVGIKIRTDDSYTAQQTDKLIKALAGDTMNGLLDNNIPFPTSKEILEAIATDALLNCKDVELKYVQVEGTEAEWFLSMARFMVDGHAISKQGSGETIEEANEMAANCLVRFLIKICGTNRWI